jgi:RND family efflux transporter MFP subunit
MTRTIAKAFLALALIAAAIVLFFILRPVEKPSPASTAATQEKTLYTCGMHPNVIQDRPGNCPICEMKLTPIKRSTGTESEGGSTPAMSTISIDPVTIQNMGIRTATVTNGPLRRVIRTVGTIEYNETALTEVTTKFKGWIERLYVDATGQQVHKGDPLFEIYSPELYSAQREYLLAAAGSSNTNAAPRNTVLESARLKLKFFDISDEQIAELEKTREPRKALRVTAPMDGFVVEKLAVEGMMVDAGMRLYRLADLGLVWVYAEIYEQDLPFIRLGQEATVRLSYLADRHFRGRVTYIYPTLNEKTRTARVRMEFHNPGFLLKPGMFASVELKAELAPSALLVPDMAVLRSGTRNTVFVALEGGKFEPRTATLGPRGEDDMLQVLNGLKEGERVVVSGQFMLDSESQLREAIQKMLNPARRLEHAHSGEPGDRESAKPGQAITSVEPHTYVCPMPEHVSVEYERPGNCPLCGMALIPVSADTLSKMQPGGKVEFYTCPMPEHVDVKAEKPGKCPKCGMTMVPVMSPPEPPAAAAGRGLATARALPVPNPLYTCPMASHAHVVSDKPGRCPECEMILVPADTVSHTKAAEEAWRKQHPASAPPSSLPQHQH